MVRKSDMRQLTGDAAAFSKGMKHLLELHSVTQAAAAEALGRTSPYAADRYRGYRSWTFDDIDKLAPLVGCENGFDVVTKVHKLLTQSQTKSNIETELRDQFRLMAYEDPNRDIEADTPDD